MHCAGYPISPSSPHSVIILPWDKPFPGAGSQAGLIAVARECPAGHTALPSGFSSQSQRRSPKGVGFAGLRGWKECPIVKMSLPYPCQPGADSTLGPAKGKCNAHPRMPLVCPENALPKVQSPGFALCGGGVGAGDPV